MMAAPTLNRKKKKKRRRSLVLKYWWLAPVLGCVAMIGWLATGPQWSRARIFMPGGKPIAGYAANPQKMTQEYRHFYGKPLNNPEIERAFVQAGQHVSVNDYTSAVRLLERVEGGIGAGSVQQPGPFVRRVEGQIARHQCVSRGPGARYGLRGGAMEPGPDEGCDGVERSGDARGGAQQRHQPGQHRRIGESGGGGNRCGGGRRRLFPRRYAAGAARSDLGRDPKPFDVAGARTEDLRPGEADDGLRQGRAGAGFQPPAKHCAGAQHDAVPASLGPRPQRRRLHLAGATPQGLRRVRAQRRHFQCQADPPGNGRRGRHYGCQRHGLLLVRQSADRDGIDRHRQPVGDVDSGMEHVRSGSAIQWIRSGCANRGNEPETHHGGARKPDLLPPGAVTRPHRWRLLVTDRVTDQPSNGSPMRYGMAEWTSNQSWIPMPRRRCIANSPSRSPIEFGPAS